MSEIDSRFPEAIQALWITLDREVTWLHGRWIIYRQLYGTSAERVELLDRSAGTFFNILQDVLLHDVQLSLSKIGDPAGSGSRQNATLEALHAGVVAAGDQALADGMRLPLHLFEAACARVRHRRNKWIAHFDRDTLLNENVQPRMGPSRDEIETALAALRDVMNGVSLHYTDASTGYEYFSMQADGEALLQRLRRAVRYDELVDTGVVPVEDFWKRFRSDL
jgi:hypothetical protein